MKKYIHRDPKWFYRLCIDIMNSDDRTIRELTRIFTGKAQEYQKNYNHINKIELNRKQNQKYANLPIEEKQRRLEENRIRYHKDRDYNLIYKKQYHKKTYNVLRLEALIYYGKGKLSCVCCGENNTRFLTLDHINNDGHLHRQKIGTTLFRWLKTHDYPPGFQTLCFNCNCGRALNNGICPHKNTSTKTRNFPPIHLRWSGVVNVRGG